MQPGRILADLSPYARVVTAVVPFIVAIALRVVLGNNRFTRALLSVSTIWFAVNVFMAPYSKGMQDDLTNIKRAMFK